MIEFANVSFGYPEAESAALSDVSFRHDAGEVLAIVGPNGSGKTTLLKVLLGILSRFSGSVRIEDRDLASWSRRELARAFGVVSQREETTFPVRVKQLVQLGRYPHLGQLGRSRPEDRTAVAEALRACDIESLAQRWVTTLSGGEWQRVRIARALAQKPRALVLDEPSSNLDLRHEMEVFELTARLVHEHGLSALIVTHNVNLAARYADRVLVLRSGTMRAQGTPNEVLNAELVREVFEWPVDRIEYQGDSQFIPRRAALGDGK